MFVRPIGRALTAGFIALVTLPAIALAAGFQTIALTGQTAPGGPPGAVFQEFGSPTINNLGDIVFLGGMQPGTGGVTVDDAIGIWTYSNGSITPVNVGDPPAPDIPGAVLEEIATVPQRSNNGAVFAEYRLEVGVGGVTADNDVGGWLFHSSGNRLVYREGSSLPGFPSDAQLSFSNTRFNASAQMAVFGIFRSGFGGVTAANNRGVWIDTGAGLQMIARSGDTAHGGPAGALIDGMGVSSFNLNAKVASLGGLVVGTGGVTDNDADVIYSSRDGLYSVEYREGGIANGTAVFDLFNSVQINNSDRLAINANLKTGVGGVTSQNSRGIWVETDSGLRQVVRTNDLMPGSTTLRYRGLSNLLVNDAGRVAFTASSTSTINFNTILSEGISGQLAMIARAGTAAPGTGTGVNFDFDTLDYPGIPKLMLNNAGQVAFFAGLSGTGVTTANDSGIWAQDTNGILQLIVREGSQIEVAPGDLRTVSNLQSYDFGNMNQQGQITFEASFVDGTWGLFVSNLVATLPGDFNRDGSVGAADYVVWRKNAGGIYTPDDYATWRAHFGQPAGSGMGAGVNGAVPESATLVLLTFAAAVSTQLWHRRVVSCRKFRKLNCA